MDVREVSRSARSLARRRPLIVLVASWALLALVGWATHVLAITVIAPLPLVAAFLLARPRAESYIDPFEPVWLCGGLFAFAYLLVPGLTLIQPRTFVSLPGYMDLPADQFELACLVSGLAFLAFQAGYWLLVGRPRDHVLPDENSEGAPIRFTLVLGAILFALGTASVGVSLHDSGISLTPGSLFSEDVRNAVTSHFSGRGYLTIGFTLLMLAPTVLTLWAARDGRRRAWLIAVLAAALAAFQEGALIGSRLGVLAIVVGFVTVVHYRAWRLSVRAFLLLALIGAGVGVAQSLARGTAQLSGVLSPAGTLTGTLDGFAQLVNALARVHHFEFGRTLVEDLGLTYLPRTLWSHKPLIYGMVRAQQAVMPGLFADFGNGRATYPVGLVAEGYVNFAIFGAVGIPLIAGAVLRRFYDLVRAARSDWGILVLAWILGNAVSLMRGFATTVLTVLLGAIVLLPLLLAERRQRVGRGAHVSVGAGRA